MAKGPYHHLWAPAIEGGPIGRGVGHNQDRVKHDVPHEEGDFMLGRTNIARPYMVKHRATSENSDDEHGPVSRYVNPAGMFGLFGNQVNYNQWSKDRGVKEPKRQTGPGINPLRGMPFKRRRGRPGSE